MKLLVVSDIHGDYDALEQAYRAEKNVGAVVFLGDGIREAERFEAAHGPLRVYMVRGNCDFGSNAPIQGLCAFEGVLFLYTHGHVYGVKGSYQALAEAAQAAHADAALFGHTHVPFCGELDGLTLFNPGTLTDGQYGVICAEAGKARFEHRRLVR